jgi:hypothetical protein
MIRYLIGVIAIAGVSTSASAQQAGLSVPDTTPATAIDRVWGGSWGLLWTGDETPSLKEQKLRRAVALRLQADAWMASNGGFLTEAQQREIRREARAIATGSRWR